MKYRKKPVVIDAVQWTGKNEIEMYNFLENKKIRTMMELPAHGANFRIDFNNGGCQIGTLIIKTLEGEHIATIGDYIIKGVKGEFYPCKPDVFDLTYEIAD